MQFTRHQIYIHTLLFVAIIADGVPLEDNGREPAIAAGRGAARRMVRREQGAWLEPGIPTGVVIGSDGKISQREERDMQDAYSRSPLIEDDGFGEDDKQSDSRQQGPPSQQQGANESEAALPWGSLLSSRRQSATPTGPDNNCGIKQVGVATEHGKRMIEFDGAVFINPGTDKNRNRGPYNSKHICEFMGMKQGKGWKDYNRYGTAPSFYMDGRCCHCFLGAFWKYGPCPPTCGRSEYKSCNHQRTQSGHTFCKYKFYSWKSHSFNAWGQVFCGCNNSVDAIKLAKESLKTANEAHKESKEALNASKSALQKQVEDRGAIVRAQKKADLAHQAAVKAVTITSKVEKMQVVDEKLLNVTKRTTSHLGKVIHTQNHTLITLGHMQNTTDYTLAALAGALNSLSLRVNETDAELNVTNAELNETKGFLSNTYDELLESKNETSVLKNQTQALEAENEEMKQKQKALFGLTWATIYAAAVYIATKAAYALWGFAAKKAQDAALDKYKELKDVTLTVRSTDGEQLFGPETLPGSTELSDVLKDMPPPGKGYRWEFVSGTTALELSKKVAQLGQGQEFLLQAMRVGLSRPNADANARDQANIVT